MLTHKSLMSLLMVLYATHSADTTKEFDVTDGWFFTRPTIDADTEDSDVTDVMVLYATTMLTQRRNMCNKTDFQQLFIPPWIASIDVLLY